MQENFSLKNLTQAPFVRVEVGQHQQRQLLGDKLNGPVVLMVLVLRQPVDALDHT